jgi:hypothetical protein
MSHQSSSVSIIRQVMAALAWRNFSVYGLVSCFLPALPFGFFYAKIFQFFKPAPNRTPIHVPKRHQQSRAHPDITSDRGFVNEKTVPMGGDRR